MEAKYSELIKDMAIHEEEYILKLLIIVGSLYELWKEENPLLCVASNIILMYGYFWSSMYQVF